MSSMEVYLKHVNLISRIKKVDKDLVEEIKVESVSSDVDDACDMAPTYLSSQRISTSSVSPSEGDQKEVDDIGNGSEFVEPSIPLETKNEMNGSPVREPDSNQEYDREAILHQLANFRNSEAERQMILDIIRWNIGSKKQESEISIKPFEYSENEDTSFLDRHELLVDGLRESLKAVPDSIMHLLTGWFRPGDCGRPFDQKPEWLDMNKFRRGQKFIQDHMLPILYAEILGLFGIYSFDQLLQPLIFTGNSDTPYTAFRRYLSTVQRMRRWYSQDPWTKGTAAYNDILVVRSMHAAVRRRLNASSKEELGAATTITNAWCPAREILLKDFSENCEVPASGQCPYLAGENNPNRPTGISQMEMAITQWNFVGLVTLCPKSLGIHKATDEDIEAFCHLWRSIGYLLGMEEQHNLCRGTLEEIRQRNRDFIDFWIKPNLREIKPEWEHMGRCIVTGMSALIPFASYKAALLHFLEMIDLKMPRFYASLSYKQWAIYNFLRLVFYYGAQLPGISALGNTIINRAFSQAEKFTPKELEAIRIKFSNYYKKNTE